MLYTNRIIKTLMVSFITVILAGTTGCSGSDVSSDLTERYSGVFDAYKNTPLRPRIIGRAKETYKIDVAERTIEIKKAGKLSFTKEEFDEVVEFTGDYGRQGIAFLPKEEEQGIITIKYYAKEDLYKIDRNHGDTSNFEDYDKVSRVAASTLGFYRFVLKKTSSLDD